MENTYHYYAFISYATTDSKWAKWLQHQLSYYHIPSAVKKSKIGVPEKIRPIFIYEYDLAGNQLHQAIEQELSASKYLILICSPSAAKSKYVNREVETFIKQGRQEYIIPFIVEGKVNASNPDEECFPPALLELMQGGNMELRGANIATNGKHQALVDVVATMLGVRRDLLWNRYKARQMKQRIALATIVVFAMLLGLFYLDYTRPTYKYYADYVDVWGVPTGVLELNKEQIEHRNGSYRFEYRRIPFGQPKAYSWRLKKVSHINSAGTPTTINETAFIDRYPIQELKYSPNNGTLTEITYCNEKERPQIVHKLSRKDDTPAAIVDIESVVAGDGVAFAKSFTAIGPNNADKTSNITRYVYERNADGYITKVTFHANNSRDFNSSAVADNFGVWGMAYELDSIGRRTTVRYLNKDGSYHCNKIGVSARHYGYDVSGGVCSELTSDLQDKPVLNEYLFSSAIVIFDKYGNMIEQNHFNTIGETCINNQGYARYTAKYDDNGNMIEVACYGIDGKPCLHNDGFAKWTAKYDERGNNIETAYYGVDGELCIINPGYAKITLKYDNCGKPIEEAYYGVDGNLCLNKDGIAKWTAKYDERGNRIEATCYGIDEKPCLDNNGVAKWTAKYDERGNIIEQVCYGLDGELCLDNDGVAKWTAKYDDRGNRFETAYYGVDGEPCLSNYGYAKYTAKYDDHRNQIETAYYNVDGTPCISIYGFSISVQNFNDKSQITDVSYYDTERKPMNVKGYFREERIYDEKNNLKETIYYDKESKLLVEQIFTGQITSVNGAALAQGVPIGSIMLQLNEWRVGDSKASLLLIQQKRYAEKKLYYLTPMGEIGYLHVKGGLMGIIYIDYMVEKSKAQEWWKQLDEWKRDKHN